ncbi:MAG: hypothetical protein M1819_007338 [Sarea resinae]|nr:MAG: hypothetical protein M1819_007338 [Sarea resinae]
MEAEGNCGGTTSCDTTDNNVDTSGSSDGDAKVETGGSEAAGTDSVVSGSETGGTDSKGADGEDMDSGNEGPGTDNGRDRAFESEDTGTDTTGSGVDGKGTESESDGTEIEGATTEGEITGKDEIATGVESNGAIDGTETKVGTIAEDRNETCGKDTGKDEIATGVESNGAIDGTETKVGTIAEDRNETCGTDTGVEIMDGMPGLRLTGDAGSIVPETTVANNVVPADVVIGDTLIDSTNTSPETVMNDKDESGARSESPLVTGILAATATEDAMLPNGIAGKEIVGAMFGGEAGETSVKGLVGRRESGTGELATMLAGAGLKFDTTGKGEIKGTEAAAG